MISEDAEKLPDTELFEIVNTEVVHVTDAWHALNEIKARLEATKKPIYENEHLLKRVADWLKHYTGNQDPWRASSLLRLVHYEMQSPEAKDD